MKLKIVSLTFFCISLILLTISSGYKLYLMLGTGAFIVFSIALLLSDFKYNNRR